MVIDINVPLSSPEAPVFPATKSHTTGGIRGKKHRAAEGADVASTTQQAAELPSAWSHSPVTDHHPREELPVTPPRLVEHPAAEVPSATVAPETVAGCTTGRGPPGNTPFKKGGKDVKQQE